MEWLKKLSAAIDYIENNLDSDISYDEAAKIACCSTFYFQRIFSYVAGVSLSEYIRRRRMTQAAFELQRTGAKVIDIALKYGYSSPTSFNRAFQSVHNITPAAARSIGNTFNAFSTHIKGNLIEATEQLLKGDYGFMCQYDEPDFETVWSSVFDLKNLMIYRAEGNPRKKKFVVDSRLHDVVQRK